MGFFDFFKQLNIDQGIEEYKRTAGAVLLDVRSEDLPFFRDRESPAFRWHLQRERMFW